MDEPKRYRVLPESVRGDESHVEAELLGYDVVFVDDDFHAVHCDNDGNLPHWLEELIVELATNGWEIQSGGPERLTFTRIVN